MLFWCINEFFEFWLLNWEEEFALMDSYNEFLLNISLVYGTRSRLTFCINLFKQFTIVIDLLPDSAPN